MPNDYVGTIWSVDLPHANHALYEQGGVVIEAPPIARWMKGKGLAEVKAWVKRNKGTIEQVCPNTAPVCDGCGATQGGFLRTDAGDFCTACAQMLKKSSARAKLRTRPAASSPSRPAKPAASPASSRQMALSRRGSAGGTADTGASSRGREPDDPGIVFE